MLSLHTRTAHIKISAHGNAQLVQACTIPEYQHPKIKMIQSITRYPDVRSPSNHHIVAACTCCAHCNINERNLSTHSDMDIRRIKDAQKTKTKLTVRNAIVRTSCARSFKHCFFDYYASHHHVLRLFPPYRPPTWSLVVTKSSAVNHCLLGSDAPCPMNMSLTGPIFFYYVNMMIID